MNSKNTKWILLLVLSLIWGSSFLLIKKGLNGLSPMQLGSLRIVFGALFLIAIGFKTLPSISKKQWGYLVLTAFFGTFAPAYLFALAETEIDSSVSSILNSLTPLNALLLGVLGFGVLINRNQILGKRVRCFGLDLPRSTTTKSCATESKPYSAWKAILSSWAKPTTARTQFNCARN